MRLNPLLLWIFVCIPGMLWAQDGPYAATSNPYYWKNRKPFEAYWQQDVAYTIHASLDDTDDRISGDEQLIYTNNSPDTLHELFFHVYQNAFIKGAYLEQLNQANGFKQKYGKHEIAGEGTIIDQMEINGQHTPIIIDNSIVRVPLSQGVLPGTSLQIHIRFRTWFDEAGSQRRRMKIFRDAWGNKQYDGVHWYPRICVYDRKFGWETDQHLGKEFYGDFGSYHVSLDLPAKYVVDATGVLQNPDEVYPGDLRQRLDVQRFKNKAWNSKPDSITDYNPSHRKTWIFKAINTHDFAWVADPTFRIGEEKTRLSNGQTVSVISLSQEPHSSGWQDAASFTAKVIQVYSNDIGYYAYPKMIVADARDGMEYPMLTLDGGRSPEYYDLLAHEVGHNWFFGMVGNNETYRASLDEGFTQFLTNWSMDKLEAQSSKVANAHGGVKKAFDPIELRDQTVYYGYIRDAINHDDHTLNTHSDDFNGALNHDGGYRHVYYKTATMLYNLQYVLGDDLFLAAMKHYFSQWEMAHPYFEDFRNSIIQYTHVDLNWFFDQWLETTKTIDYSIEKIHTTKQANTYQITLKRKGSMQMPIDLMAYSKDGKIYTHHIPNTYFIKDPSSLQQRTIHPTWKGWGILNPTYTTEIHVPGGLRSLQIDTTYRLADINLLDNSNHCPHVWSFDGFVSGFPNRRTYQFRWRPDVWYNAGAGLKAGIKWSGNYMNYKHVFNLYTYVNTGLFKQYSNDFERFNYQLNYSNGIAKNTYVKIGSMWMDGIQIHRLELEKVHGAQNFRLYVKFLELTGNGAYAQAIPNTGSYGLLTQIWAEQKWNNSINLEYERRYQYANGNGRFKAHVRGSFLFTDYNYNSVSAEWVNNHALGKLELLTRIYAQQVQRLNVAPESQLYVSGANPEQYADSKWNRAAGIIPSDWMMFGGGINHWQAGGGLNIRGYAGYLLPVNDGAYQYYLYKGNSGISTNIELDYDKFISLHSRYTRWLRMDAYLFADAGILGQLNTLNGTKPTYLDGTTKMVNSGLLVSTGPGFVAHIRARSYRTQIPLFALRADFPLFINNKPFNESNNLAFRWVLGINRSF